MSVTGCYTCIKGLQPEKNAIYACLGNQGRRKIQVMSSASEGNRGFGSESAKKGKVMAWTINLMVFKHLLISYASTE